MHIGSFREEVTLDLSATKMTEFSERVVNIGSEKILPVAAIYGANASGKSNIYSAFEYMRNLYLQRKIPGNFQISCCVVMKSGLLRRMIEVFQHYTPLQILWMRMECIFARTKAMRRII